MAQSDFALFPALPDLGDVFSNLNVGTSTMISGGHHVYQLRIRGWDGGDDACVQVDFLTPGVDATDDAGYVHDGRLHVPLMSRFSFLFPVSMSYSMEVDYVAGRLELELATGHVVVGGIAKRGNDAFSFAESGSESVGTYNRAFYDFFDYYDLIEDLIIDDEIVDAILAAAMDIDLPNGATCGGSSIGVEITVPSYP